MDLRNYYSTIRRIEDEIREEWAVITAGGARVEVPRGVAARMIAEGKAELASAEEAAKFRAEAEARWRAAQRGR